MEVKKAKLSFICMRVCAHVSVSAFVACCIYSFMTRFFLQHTYPRAKLLIRSRRMNEF